jgi:hypothetical protein
MTWEQWDPAVDGPAPMTVRNRSDVPGLQRVMTLIAERRRRNQASQQLTPLSLYCPPGQHGIARVLSVPDAGLVLIAHSQVEGRVLTLLSEGGRTDRACPPRRL